jgi:hypothetical protein
MKAKTNTIMALAVVLAIFYSAVLSADVTGYGARGAEGRSDLTLEQMLIYSIQDEYLARAEYELIMNEHGQIRPFSNIIRAEERHVEWLQELFGTRNLAVPEDTAAEHVVLPESMKAAVEAGVQAELENIAMYASFLKQDLPADVREVFERLKGASENHLEAFRRQLSRYN